MSQAEYAWSPQQRPRASRTRLASVRGRTNARRNQQDRTPAPQLAGHPLPRCADHRWRCRPSTDAPPIMIEYFPDIESHNGTATQVGGPAIGSSAMRFPLRGVTVPTMRMRGIVHYNVI